MIKLTASLLAVGAGLLAACSSEAESDQSEEALGKDEVGLSSKELLGKRLFEDKNLSEPKGQSCASCHDAKQAFTGSNGSKVKGVSLGSRAGVVGGRNAPSAMYMQYSPRFHFAIDKDDKGETTYTPTGGYFWDGRADDLAAQAKGPFLNPREMNNPSAEAVVAKVKGGKYAQLAKSVFGESVFSDPTAAYDSFAEAIAAFEKTKRFNPFSSKFDRVLQGKAKFSTAEARGFALFKDPNKGNCIGCHVGDEGSKKPSDWLFTDFTYDNIGVPRNSAIPDNADATHFDLGLCKRDGIDAKVPKGMNVEDFCGAFKVPTLRNIEKTAPYMHNGAIATLRDAVKFYATRDTNPELWYPKGKDGKVQKFNDLPEGFQKYVNTEEPPLDRKLGDKPRLNDNEIDDIVSFLRTLTDE